MSSDTNSYQPWERTEAQGKERMSPWKSQTRIHGCSTKTGKQPSCLPMLLACVEKTFHMTLIGRNKKLKKKENKKDRRGIFANQSTTSEESLRLISPLHNQPKTPFDSSPTGLLNPQTVPMWLHTRTNRGTAYFSAYLASSALSVSTTRACITALRLNDFLPVTSR